MNYDQHRKTCPFEQYLLDAADGTLANLPNRRQVEYHLRHCKACQTQLSALQLELAELDEIIGIIAYGPVSDEEARRIVATAQSSILLDDLQELLDDIGKHRTLLVGVWKSAGLDTRLEELGAELHECADYVFEEWTFLKNTTPQAAIDEQLGQDAIGEICDAATELRHEVCRATLDALKRATRVDLLQGLDWSDCLAEDATLKNKISNHRKEVVSLQERISGVQRRNKEHEHADSPLLDDVRTLFAEWQALSRAIDMLVRWVMNEVGGECGDSAAPDWDDPVLSMNGDESGPSDDSVDEPDRDAPTTQAFEARLSRIRKARHVEADHEHLAHTLLPKSAITVCG